MYVSSVYSRCFISSLIPISRYDHHESVASSHSFISALVLSHSLALFYTSRSSCVLRVDYVCVCLCVCCVFHIIKCISLLFFFYIKYRISDDLTKLYPGINVLYAAREGDRSRRKVLRLFVQPISTCDLRDRYFQLSPLSAIRLVIYLDIRLCDDRPTSVSRSSTACPFLRNPFKHVKRYNFYSPSYILSIGSPK